MKFKNIILGIMMLVLMTSVVSAINEGYNNNLLLNIEFNNNYSIGESTTTIKDTSVLNLSGAVFDSDDIIYVADYNDGYSMFTNSTHKTRIIVPDNDELLFAVNDNFSFGLDIYLKEPVPSYTFLFGKYGASSSYSKSLGTYSMFMSGSSVFCAVGGFTSSSVTDWFEVGAPLQLNQSMAVTCSYTNGSLIMMVDEMIKSVDTETFRHYNSLSTLYDGADIKIGGMQTGTNNMLMNANIDNIKVWNTTLSNEGEILGISYCQALKDSNHHYILTKDIYETSGKFTDCLTIESDNISIDLNGYGIYKYKSDNVEWNGEDSGGSAINLNGHSNVEIHNGTIYNFWYGVAGEGYDINVHDIYFNNDRTGCYFTGANNIINNNIFRSNTAGVYTTYTGDNINYTITNNMFDKNDYGLRYGPSGDSIIANNYFNLNGINNWDAYSTNFQGVLNLMSSPLYVNNIYKNTRDLDGIIVSSYTGEIGEQINFSTISKNVFYKTDDAADIEVKLYPNEKSLEYSYINGQLNASFIPTHNGKYSLSIIINFADDNNVMNELSENTYTFIIGGAENTERFYLRSQIPFTQNQVSSLGGGYDIGEMISTPPVSEENRWCGQWYQFYMDEPSEYENLVITNIHSNVWYNFSYKDGDAYDSSDNIVIGIDQDGSFNSVGNDWYQLDNETQPTKLGINDFDLELPINHNWEWYKWTFKLYEETTVVHKYPYMKTTPANPSYLDITYKYADSPIVNALSTTNTNILSTYSYFDKTSYVTNIVLDGHEWTNLTVTTDKSLGENQFLSILYDGVSCDDAADCIVYSLSDNTFIIGVGLGSIHDIDILFIEREFSKNVYDGIEGVSSTVFIGFGLLAVALLAGIAFLFVKMFEGGFDAASLIAMSIMAIGLAIVLFVGYIVISAVARGLIG